MNIMSTLGGLLRRPEAGAFLGLVAVLIFFVIFGGLMFLEDRRAFKLAQCGGKSRHHRHSRRPVDDRR